MRVLAKACHKSVSAARDIACLRGRPTVPSSVSSVTVRGLRQEKIGRHGVRGTNVPLM